jgi:hypothetical protein
MTHSPRSSIGCVQDEFWAYGMLGTNYAPILCQDWHYLQMDSNELSLDLVTYEYHQVRPKRFPSLWYVQRKPCTYLAVRLAPSTNGTERDST